MECLLAAQLRSFVSATQLLVLCFLAASKALEICALAESVLDQTASWLLCIRAIV